MVVGRFFNSFLVCWFLYDFPLIDRGSQISDFFYPPFVIIDSGWLNYVQICFVEPKSIEALRIIELTWRNFFAIKKLFEVVDPFVPIVQ